MVHPASRLGPDKPLDIAGRDARASILHPDRSEPVAAPHPAESSLGRLPEPPRRPQDRDRPLPLPLDVVCYALTFGLCADVAGLVLGLLLGAERDHRLGPLRRLTATELRHVRGRLEPPQVRSHGWKAVGTAQRDCPQDLSRSCDLESTESGLGNRLEGHAAPGAAAWAPASFTVGREPRRLRQSLQGRDQSARRRCYATAQWGLEAARGPCGKEPSAIRTCSPDFR